MGRWQKVYLKRDEAEDTTSNAGTVTLDLPEEDYISQLTIVPELLNTALTNDYLLTLFDAIAKIEVLDGSEVIKSLSGAQVQALAYYWGRTNPCPHRIDWEATRTYDYFYLRFGRYPEDMKFMLDMSKLTNPQLKIEYDISATTRFGKTPDVEATPAFEWSVLADIYRGAPPAPVEGFFRSQQIYDWTQAATATKYIDIPRTEPIIGLMLRGGYPGKRLLQDFNRVRLNINTGAFVPFDVYEQLLAALQEEWFMPPPEVHYRIQQIGGKIHDSGLGLCIAPQAQLKGGYREEPRISGNVGGFIKLELRDPVPPDWDITQDVPYFIAAKGLFPHHTIYLPMEKVTEDGEFTLDAQKYSKILLEVTSASASTSAKPTLVLETLGR